MDAEKVFLDNVALIDRIAAFVSRRHRLQPADADDFGAHVRFRLYDDDCAILRKFGGRSSLSTYLMTVIQRLLYEYRVQIWGKWRPSAEAKRLGETAILLERMLTRDGYTLDGAIQELTAGEAPLVSRRELEAIASRLPQRHPRPVLVSEGMSADVAAPIATDEGVLRSERLHHAQQAAAAIDRMIESFDAEDRLILQFRFWHGLRVSEIADILHCDAKRLYKRIDRLVGRLRGGVAAAGVPREALADLLEHGDEDFPIPSIRGWGKASGSPSDVVNGEMTTGKGRLSS